MEGLSPTEIRPGKLTITLEAVLVGLVEKQTEPLDLRVNSIMRKSQSLVELAVSKTTPAPGQGVESSEAGLSRGRLCIDRRHPLQVFRDMVNTFPRPIGPFKNEVHRALEEELYQYGTPP